jgi:ribosomal protein S18 acetylase RimI-like enzyme
MIRQSTQNDVLAVESITQAVWDQKIDHKTFRDHVDSDTRVIRVAIKNDHVAGFVSTFLTVDVHNNLRWEIDLLVVNPENQGQGWGTALIQSVWEDAQKHKATFARAMVRTDNIASQKAFAHAGYSTNGKSHHLYLWPPQKCATQVTIPKDVTFLPMDTLTYRGLWIEGLISPHLTQKDQSDILSKAQDIVATQKRHNTGAAIPVGEEATLSEAIRNKGKIHGEYNWWIKSVKE